MSLIDSAMEDVVILDKRRTPDGEGGFDVEWVDGATIKAAITFNNTLNAKIAQAEGVTSVFNVTTHKNAQLEFHDVIRRVSDGKTFRITSDGTDRTTPDVASFQFSKVSAEEWSLPT